MSKFSWLQEAVPNNNNNSKFTSDFHILTKYETGMFDMFLQQNNITVDILRLIPEQYYEICNFYLNHGNDEDNEIFIIEPKILHNLSYLDFYTIQMRKNNELIGCVFVIFFPVKITIDNKCTLLNSVHTSFLCIHNNYRRMGLGGILIRQVIEHGFRNIQEKQTKLGIHILQEMKYPCPSIDIYNCIISNTMEKIQGEYSQIQQNYSEEYHNEYSKQICFSKIVNDNYQIAYNLWNSDFHSNKHQILFCPSEDYFKKWCLSFPTYLIHENINDTQLPLFMFSLFQTKILHGKDIILSGYITLFKINDILQLINIQDNNKYRSIIRNICRIICEICLQENIKLLIIPDVGNFPVDILLNLHVEKNDKCSYFGVYNLNFLPTVSQIAYPYF